jgi:hypothetical protein
MTRKFDIQVEHEHHEGQQHEYRLVIAGEVCRWVKFEEEVTPAVALNTMLHLVDPA